MKDWKNIGMKLLFPPVWIMVVLGFISAASLVTVFLKGLDTAPIAYAVYVLSFYALSVICIKLYKVMPRYYRAGKKKIYDNKYGNRYMTDVVFKTHVSLYTSLTINLLFAAANLWFGIWQRSVWFITLAVYYIILAVTRFLLLRFVNKNGIGKEYLREVKRAKICGIILMTLNLALSGVVVLVIEQNQGFRYGEILIYVMAMYTFYITTAAIINIFKYRKYNSPIMSTAKYINLAAALVSMLALETAMLSQFGGENTNPHFNAIMVGLTGAGVCAVVVAMSIYIIVKSNREMLKENKNGKQ